MVVIDRCSDPSAPGPRDPALQNATYTHNMVSIRCQRRRGALLSLAVIAIAIAKVKVRRFEIVERSMEPELLPGDYVIAIKQKRTWRGQIIIFELPGVPNFDVVKRVIGLQGETVRIAAGHILIDGTVLADPWAQGSTYPDGEWRVGKTQLFVLGDSRIHSSGDSRRIGPIGVVTTPWTVICRYWPPRRAANLQR